MTDDEYTRLQDDGNPNCPEHAPTRPLSGRGYVTIGGKRIPVVWWRIIPDPERTDAVSVPDRPAS